MVGYPGVSNTNPTDRATFKQYVLRRLGAPVIEINVSDEQVEDRLDDALIYYYDYHYDGTYLQYYKYAATANDCTNGYITLPDNVIGAVDIFDGGASYGSADMFNIRYQIALNDLYTLTSVSLVPYYMAMSHIAQLEELLVGRQPLRYNRVDNKLYIDMDWATEFSTVMPFLIIKCYTVLDPQEYPRVFAERWLRDYATALVKEQWGTNLKKFSGMQMPGGLTFNGQMIYNEAREERLRLENELINFALPATDMIG
jgi:hypothetical protein